MTHEELEDVVRRHELDIADLRKQNEQFTASLKTFILSFPSAYTDIGEEATGQLRAQLISHFNDLRDRLGNTDKSSPE
jgi:hypothetical protein